MGSTKEAEEAWYTSVKGLGTVLGPYLHGRVCVSTGQPGCLCCKDPETETSDAVSPRRVLAGHQSLSNTCCVPATLPVLSRLIPILYLEAGVLIPVYRQGSGRLMYFAKVTNQG